MQLFWVVLSCGMHALLKELQISLSRCTNKSTMLLNNDLEAATKNPVKKIPLVVSGHDGEVYMDEIVDDLVGGGDRAAPAGDGGAVAAAGGGFIDRPIGLQLLAMH
jgi:hypothetical protein